MGIKTEFYSEQRAFYGWSSGLIDCLYKPASSSYTYSFISIYDP